MAHERESMQRSGGDEELPCRAHRRPPPHAGPDSSAPGLASIHVTSQEDLTGLLESFQPHDHLCLIYESKEEWRATAIPFIAIGLQRGEKCIYVVDQHTADEIRLCLTEESVAVAAVEQTGQLFILDQGEAYTTGGSFDPDRMIAFLIEKTGEALAAGYPALRVTGEMSWVLRGYPGSERLLEYSAQLNRDFFPHHMCLALFQYDRWAFDPDTIKGILMTHPLLIRGTHLYRNFYYVPPEDYLNTTRSGKETEHWLNNLERERQHEESLLASEARYRALFAQSITAISLVSPDDHFIDVNQAWLDLFGYTRKELPDLRVQDIYADPADREDFLKRIAETGSVRDEARFKRKDGSIFLCQRSTVANRDRWGRLTAYQGMYHDITESKAAELALRESEEKYRALFEQSTDALSLASPDGRTLEVNQAWLDLFGYTREEVRTITASKLYADINERESFLKRMAESRSVKDVVRLKRKDGTVFDCQRTAFVRTDEKGQVIAFQNILRDVTQERRREQELVESEGKYRALFEQSMDAIWALNPDGTGNEVNQAWLDLMGYRAEDIPLLSAVAMYANPRDRESFLRLIAETGLVRDEVLFKRKDGTEVLCERAVVALKNGSGRVVRFQGVLRDITERKQAEMALKESEERLRELAMHLEEVREEERTGIARELHDQVGQALTALKLDLMTAEQAFRSGKDVTADWLAGMARLVDDTTDDVRRISSELRPGMLDDVGLVAAMEWQMEQFRKRTGIDSVLTATGNPEPDRSTSTALYRVFQELLTNVARHANAKNVRVTFEQRGSNYILEVADDGRGIAESESTSSSSLGIVGIRERLRPLGGEIRFSGIPQEGTTVRVIVPAR